MKPPVEYAPRPYQKIMEDHVYAHNRCALWAGMGVGKTVSTLTALSGIKLLSDAPVLVLAPLRVATSTWPFEAAKWKHTWGTSVVPITGTVRERFAALERPADVHTINYDNLPWLVEHLGDKWPYETVVADESTKLKGFRLRQGGMRARALARVAHHQVKRFVQLTGTPAPNGLKDLWGQMWFLDKGERLGRTFDAFTTRWFTQNYNGFGYKPRDNAQDEIQRVLSDICLTIRAKDWFDLKEPIVSTVYVDLPPKAREVYNAMEKEMFSELEGGGTVEAFNAAARTIKCLQMANGAVYVDKTDAKPESPWKAVHDLKIQALDEILEEAAGMPVLVAYHFKSDLARLQKAFPEGRVLDKSAQTERDWNAGKIPVLFAHPQSAGHGLNLQDGGNILVFFGHWWNLEERQQIAERIGPTRQLQSGHDRPVFIYNIVARDTVDEMVIERTESKRDVQDILLDAMRRRAV